MVPDDTMRQTLGLSALAGGSLWGLYHLATSLLSGQPVHLQEIVLAALNVAAAMLMGGLVAYFLGPALAPYVPVEGLREPHALGFGIGASAYILAPVIFKALPTAAARWLGRKSGEGVP